MEKGEMVSRLIRAGWSVEQAQEIVEVISEDGTRDDRQTRVVRSEEVR